MISSFILVGNKGRPARVRKRWSLVLILFFLAILYFTPGSSYAQQRGPSGATGTGPIGLAPALIAPTPSGAPGSQTAPTGIMPSQTPGTPGITTPTAIPPAQPAPVQPTQPPAPSPPPVAPPQAEVRSPYELSYSSPVPQEVSRNLKQFGYDLFTSPASTFAPVTDVPVGPDYVLGPGDTLQVYMWGLVENVFTLPVNRKGEIFLPKVGTLPVWGMTFSQVDTLIRDQLSRYFSGFKLSLAMGELRTIKVFVVGEVSRPGSYTLSSLSTAFNALFAAGGPTKLGTLRNIKLIRNNHTVGTIDLYDFLLKGDKSQDYRLESGDTVFVPPIGPVVGIAGNVKRPAIYELKGPTRVADLIEMAGGVLPVGYLQRVQIERVQAHAEKIVVDFDLSQFYARKEPTVNIELKEGDLVKIFPIDTRIYNTVTLEGFVKHPGDYELKPGMKLSDLLRPEEVLPEAFLERVELIRTRLPELTREVIALDLKRLWQGDRSQDIELLRLDKIVVSSEYRGPETVTLMGEVKRPGKYTIRKGERLSSVIKRAGGFTDKAYLKGAVFTRESVRMVQKEKLDQFIKAQEQRLIAETAALTTAATSKEEATAEAQSLAQRRELLRLLAQQVTLGRVVIKLDQLERFEGSTDDIPLEDGDTLMVPTPPSSVLVLGAVRNPTAVLYQEGENMDYYLARAGGLSKEADKGELHIIKADGSTISSFLGIRKIEPGDTIIAPTSVEVKYRPLPLWRDIATIVGQFAITIAALAVIF